MIASAYSVRVRCDSARTADAYIAWLRDGHVQEVVDCGAVAAAIVRLDPDATSALGFGVEVRYTFPDRAAMDAYLRDHAPRLRAIGTARWGSVPGIAFERTTGAVVETYVPTRR